MEKLYRQHVLKEQAGPDLVQIGSIAPAPRAAEAKPQVEEREEVGSFGD